MKRRTLKIETRQTVDPIPYAANARTHTEAQVAMIAGSIRRFGWANPVLVEGENGIIAGHGRGARRAEARGRGGAGDRVCRPVGSGPARPHHRRQPARRARGWDDALLAAELGALRDVGFPLGEIGFSENDPSKLLGDLPGDDGGAGEDSAYREQYGVIVLCRDAAHQEEVYDVLQAAGYECKVVVT